jgi:hypothetical protein
MAGSLTEEGWHDEAVSIDGVSFSGGRVENVNSPSGRRVGENIVRVHATDCRPLYQGELNDVLNDRALELFPKVYLCERSTTPNQLFNWREHPLGLRLANRKRMSGVNS